MIILGISCLYHDAAAALLKDGNVVAAAQEERFTRIKSDHRIPVNAIRFCLMEVDIKPEDIDYVVYYDKPMLTLDRFMHNLLQQGKDNEDLLETKLEEILSDKMWVHERIEKAIGTLGKYGKLLVCEHHVSHASSAFYASPYDKSVIITNDGVGEWATTTIGVGRGNMVELMEEIRYPHSIGLLYSAFTYYCGFKVNFGDYKFMGLAPYGEPVFYDVIKESIIDIREDGSYKLNMEYFDYQNGRTMIKDDKFEGLFGKRRRLPETEITKHYMDIAASVQMVLEEIIIKMAIYAKKKYGQGINNLVLAGGVALNCVANGKLLSSGIFDNIWIQPAAGDAGGALGAAQYVYHAYLKKERVVNPSDSQCGSYLGNSYDIEQIKSFLEINHYKYHYYEEDKLYKKIAQKLAAGNVIGLFQGRMEFGPRALGNRSIIADPRDKNMQSKLNLKIKFRESFRPFAPSVLYERVSDYFEMDVESPYMLFVAKIIKERRLPFDLKDYLTEEDDNLLPIINRERSDIPAITHVDYSARIQTVKEDVNPFYYRVIKEFESLTGCGVLVNTSFNVRGEPIVCTPKEAYECFMRTDMDILVLENFILLKEEQDKFQEVGDWRDKYELD